jgi:hypothetical protein
VVSWWVALLAGLGGLVVGGFGGLIVAGLIEVAARRDDADAGGPGMRPG